MTLRRHLAQRLAKDVDDPVVVVAFVFGQKILEIMFEKDNGRDIFEGLRFPVLLQLLLANERPDMGDRRRVVAIGLHDLARKPRMMRAAGAPPVVVAATSLRIIAARNFPAAQMLGAGGDLQEVGRVRIKRRQPRAHALGVEALERLSVDPAGVFGVGGVDGRECRVERGHVGSNPWFAPTLTLPRHRAPPVDGFGGRGDANPDRSSAARCAAPAPQSPDRRSPLREGRAARRGFSAG